jgi:hypothetical protein
LARRHYRQEPRPPEIPGAPTRLRLAWFSLDDLRPFVTMIVQLGAGKLRMALRALHTRSFRSH